MKLLYCKACSDVFSLAVGRDKACGCGKTRGRYTTSPDAVYTGKEAVPLAIDNYSFMARVKRDEQPDRQWFYDAMHGKGKVHCWIMQEGNPNFETIKKLSLEEYRALK